VRGQLLEDLVGYRKDFRFYSKGRFVLLNCGFSLRNPKK
jgi:hypothetical protein